ncbi:MAG TPA: Flp pilus assembly protein CpaB [Trinickia sp.]|jgi:pilus assembly protein CpaB|nr:Flp pilus assembly protein CpaB [Trinickia sp.]
MANLTKVLAGILIAAALVLGLLAWSLSRRPPAPAMHAAPIAQVTFPVVVAVRLLPAGQPIAADALRIERLPVRPGGTFAEPMQLVRRMPLADIEPGVPVFVAQLSSGFPEQVEPGERAVAVHVDEASAVGDRVRPGNFVDVFLTLKRDAGGIDGHSEIVRSQARLLLSRVRVLAFGDTLPAGGNPDERTVHARTAVLAVPTADVDRLALADSAGHLLLALRNPRDAEVVDPAFAPLLAAAPARMRSLRADPTSSTLAAAGISLSALSGSDGVHAVAPSRRTGSGGGQIEVIRGGRAETLAY